MLCERDLESYSRVLCADLHPDAIGDSYATFKIYPVRHACSVLRDSAATKIDAFTALAQKFRATLQSSGDLSVSANDLR